MMAIISAKRAFKKTNVNLEVSYDILEEMKAYCSWAGISELSYFVEEAASFIFAKDKEWKANKKGTKRRARGKASEDTAQES
jgi:hypothetical protein